MGGTSLDICLIENKKPGYTTESQIGGYPIRLPMIDIHTIGAGGGSIAWIDAGKALRVGPKSAGAVPGPVCYGKGGTEPTVTDANVVLGRINPNYILDGSFAINTEEARRVIESNIAKPLGLTVDEAAAGIIRVVNANMVRGIRVVSVEKGYDPREFSLVAFGGAGPAHAVELARELNMREVIIPINPGITSALGMLTADVRHDYVQTYVKDTSVISSDEINHLFKELEVQAVRQLTAEGFCETDMCCLRSLDMRYYRQAYELSVDLPGGKITQETIIGAEKAFHEKHERLYGYRRQNDIVELINVRVIAIGKLPKMDFSKAAVKKEQVIPRPSAYRKVFLDDRSHTTPIYQRSGLLYGNSITGPAIIEQLDSTTLVFPGQEAVIDQFGNIHIHLEGGVTYE
ncbi:MAG: hydantoinase/oxoprolinase family protein [Bacillota bacterium]